MVHVVVAAAALIIAVKIIVILPPFVLLKLKLIRVLHSIKIRKICKKPLRKI